MNNDDILISHPKEKNTPEKPLKKHLKNVASSAQNKIANLRLNLTIISQKDLKRLAWLIGLFHDFGKATTYFQAYIRKKRKGGKMTRHSFISAVVCYHVVKNEFDHIWALVAYLIIKKHHGNLETIKDNEEESIEIAGKQLKNILSNNAEKLKDIYSDEPYDVIEILNDLEISKFENELDEFEDIIDEFGEDEEQKIELFLIISLLFSLLIDNDKKDAARLNNKYFAGNLEEAPMDVFKYLDDCRHKDPKKYSRDIPLNQLRNQFLDEIKSNKEIHPDNHFYTITAPTGIGKTFGCMAFASRLKEQLKPNEGRMIYCLPYTSIIDQNFDEFEKIFRFNKGEKYEKRPNRYLLKHHYLEFKKVKNRISEEEYSYKDYLDDRLLIESWEASLVVTTFVQFFHTIIGYQNGFLKKFHNIVNSIVILDEVQNINPEYYSLLRSVLHILGKKFNTYFLLITATQPEILDKRKSRPVEIVRSSEYMTADIFNRVKLKILQSPMSLDGFMTEFCQSFDGENCLIVMNTKKSAIKLHRYIKDKKINYKTYCLTTYLTPFDRRKKIKEIKQMLEAKRKSLSLRHN